MNALPDPWRLNLRHLRAVAEVARAGRISVASARVHLSQPAITQGIARLETQLGARLFARSAAGMHPTPAGERFAARIDRALARLDAEAEAVRKRAAGRGGFERFTALMTMAQMRALVAVVRAESFSLAAREAGISQPSLHRAARDLERIAGVELFARTARGVRPTVAARNLARAARLAFAELEAGIAELASEDGAETGLIRVGTMPLARAFVLPRAINRLAEEAPDVVVRAIEGPYSELLHALRHGELDFLIGALRNPAPAEDVVEEVLFRDPLVVVARHGHPLTTRDRITPADLARYPWVVPMRGAPSRAAFEALFATPPTRIVETGSLAMIRELLRGSNRLTLMSAQQIRIEEEAQVLARLDVDLSHTARAIGLTTRRDWLPTRAQTRLIAHLRAVSGDLPRNGAIG